MCKEVNCEYEDISSRAGAVDLRQEIIRGTKTTWYATRYRNQMKPDGLLFSGWR